MILHELIIELYNYSVQLLITIKIITNQMYSALWFEFSLHFIKTVLGVVII